MAGACPPQKCSFQWAIWKLKKLMKSNQSISHPNYIEWPKHHSHCVDHWLRNQHYCQQMRSGLSKKKRYNSLQKTMYAVVQAD